MKVIVTGAAGFIGQAVTRVLKTAGHSVFGLGTRSAPEGLDGWLRVDPSAPLDVERLPEDAEAIIHLAQSSAYRRGAEGEAEVFNTNLAQFSELLRWARDTGVSALINASTGTVYEPFDRDLSEDGLCEPTGYYGASKLAAEVLANSYRNALRVAHIRLFFVYGPGQQNMLMARLIETLDKGKAASLPEKGDGLIFCPTYVEDVAKVFVYALEQNWEGTFNFASPENLSFHDVLKIIAHLLDVELKLERKGPEPRTHILPDLQKFQSHFPDFQFTPFAKGIEETIRHYQSA